MTWLLLALTIGTASPSDPGYDPAELAPVAVPEADAPGDGLLPERGRRSGSSSMRGNCSCRRRSSSRGCRGGCRGWRDGS